MTTHLFYTSIAESLKVGLYVAFLVMILIALWEKRQGNDRWANWIHAVILLNFIIGGLYGGIRMLTTDPMQDMLIRRMFAWEAWFCFASASFYFLGLHLFSRRN
ncbi:MAG: hypothetical protein GXO90_05590 [FCB group bacterium]|nr:hypothetical protein [FCB group bacterium]